MDKAEVKYNEIKDNLKFKEKYKVEDPIIALKYEIDELKAAAIFTKTKYVVPGKVGERSRDITNWTKTPPKNEKLYKYFNGKIIIGLKATESMLHSGKLTNQKNIAASRRNIKNMEIGRINPIMNPTT